MPPSSFNPVGSGNPHYDSLISAGIEYLRMGKPKVAQDYLKQAAEIKIDDPLPWLWLAKTTNDPQEQLQYLETAVATDPFDEAARAALARCRMKLKGEQPVEAFRSGEPDPAPASNVPVDIMATTYKCEKCGGGMIYQAGSDALVCTQCGFNQADKYEDALDDQGNVLDYALVSERGHRWAESRYRVHCSQCGANSVLPPTKKTGVCPYCGSEQVVKTSDTEGMLEPDRIITMQLDAEQAAGIFNKWLGSGFFIPDDLSKMVKRAALRPGYYPFWMFEATFRANWAAEENRGSQRYPRWEPIKGTQTLFYEEVLVPGNSRVRVSDLKQIEPFDFKKAQKFSSETLAGWAAFAYDKSVADANLDGRAKITNDARAKTERKVRTRGRPVRNFRMSPGKFSGQKYELIFLPLWVGVYHYQGEEYHVTINGQTGKLSGRKPVDTVKIWMLVAAGVIVILLLLMLFVFINRDAIMNTLG